MRVGHLVTVMAVLLSVPAAGCSDDGDDPAGGNVVSLPVDDEEIDGAPPPDDSPFCRTMLELDEDATLGIDEILAAYVDLADEVPPAIRPEYDVVVRRLVAIDRGEEVDDPAAAEEAARALAEFIDITCRGTTVSPLPGPTEPE